MVLCCGNIVSLKLTHIYSLVSQMNNLVSMGKERWLEVQNAHLSFRSSRLNHVMIPWTKMREVELRRRGGEKLEKEGIKGQGGGKGSITPLVRSIFMVVQYVFHSHFPHSLVSYSTTYNRLKWKIDAEWWQWWHSPEEQISVIMVAVFPFQRIGGWFHPLLLWTVSCTQTVSPVLLESSGIDYNTAHIGSTLTTSLPKAGESIPCISLLSNCQQMLFCPQNS